MASLFLIPPELRDRIKRPAAMHAVLPLREDDHRHVPDEATTAPAEAEEALVDDPRGRLTPTQMVDLKLLALQRTGNPGLFLQAEGRPQDVRRIPGGEEAPIPPSPRLESSPK